MMTMFHKFLLAAFAAVLMAFSFEEEIVYRDASAFPLYGKATPDTYGPFTRFPASFMEESREPLWNLSLNSAGLYIRFRSDAPSIHARWTNTGYHMPHMTDVGVGGLDLYSFIDGKWLFVGSGFDWKGAGNKSHERRLVGNMDGEMREYMLYLPLYDGVDSLAIGVPAGYTLEGPRLESPQADAPIVCYGTSILQGGCASRPGMAHTAILGRMLDREVINLGFSGNAHLDMEVARLMASVSNPAVYVMDNLPNCTPAMIRERTKAFVDILRRAHPGVPVVFVEDPIFPHSIVDKSVREGVESNNAALREVYAQLLASGYKNLFYVSAEGMTGDDGESFVDGVHLTDLGMLRYARHVAPVLREALACEVLEGAVTPVHMIPEDALYLDESAPAEARVEDLMNRLTPDEKISLLVATSPGIPRLGIPKYYHGNEALHGIVRPGKFTVFPQAIGLASTWDPEFLQKVAGTISDEARARWNELVQGLYQKAQFSDLLTFWSPTINMARDPRWGRTPETYGEDPFLTGEMGAAFVRGLQGDDPRYLKVVSTPKHFAANNEEHNRFVCNALIEEKQLREYYLPAYESCVRRGGAQSIMSSYNAINGIPSTANGWLLTKVLRDDWGFKGYVVSDCGAVGNLLYDHHFVASREEAAAAAIKAGLDLECGDDIFREPLKNALEAGLVSQDDIDRAARNVLNARMRLGFFDDPSHVPFNHLSPAIVGSTEHRELALETARKAIVLLKNKDGFLPLDASRLKSLAVVGVNADKCEFGDYSGEPVTRPVSILEGIRKLVGDEVEIHHAPWQSGEELALARECDAVVAVMGIDRSIEREGKDRDDIGLPANQEAFLHELYAANPSVVLVLVAGSSLSITWEDETLPAIVDAWYPGQEGGTAVAEVLFGQYNPAGRLPLTWYRSVEDLPAFDDYDITKRTYKYFQGPVLYPFGHGLSYSEFRYDRLRVKDRGETIEVSLNLTNIGPMDGDEVVQVYVRLPEYEGKAPVRELRGFRRVHLKKGERQRVRIPLRREDLRYWSPSRQCFVVPDGIPEIFVGASSSDIRLEK